MNAYQPGQRVTLTHLTTSDSRLRPGDRGTVRQVDADQQTVTVDWDNGTHRLIRLDHGDRIEALPAGPLPAAGPDRTWDQVMTAVRDFAADTGRAAADAWRQQTLGDAATDQTKATAWETLTGITDDDPDVLDSLPLFATSDGTITSPAYAGLAAVMVGDAPVSWRPESSTQWAPATVAYETAYDTAVRVRISEICRAIVSPTGDGRDLSHLHPDHVRLGHAGVFSGEWMLADNGWREAYRIGFVGTLVDHWNGWAVFTCTRQVADAIVADLEQDRDTERASLRASGVAEHDLDRRVNATLTVLGFDGDTLVVDQRAMQDDEQAIERINPDADGQYVVMGRNWQWEAVDPDRCTRIVGDLPEPGQQQFVPLAHTPGMRLPHDRLKLTLLRHWPTPRSLAYVAALTLDGKRVGTVGNDGAGGGTDLLLSGSAFGDQQWRQYLDQCRYHGQPVTQQRLLDALADEVYLSAAVTQAHQDFGGTQLRLIDPDGHTLALRPIAPAPRDLQALLELGGELAREHATGEWQIWDGRAWFTVPGSTPWRT